MSIPGFERGSRWASEDGETGFFVLYELQSYDILTSAGYLDRLNDPTPWSKKMMPHHLNMVRSQCRVLESAGGGIAQFMTTIRFSPADGDGEALRLQLKPWLAELHNLPGLTGAHLLQTDTPQIAATAEQRIRGGDQIADWILLISGYDRKTMALTADERFGDDVFRKAARSAVTSNFRLDYSLAAFDLQRGG